MRRPPGGLAGGDRRLRATGPLPGPCGVGAAEPAAPLGLPPPRHRTSGGEAGPKVPGSAAAGARAGRVPSGAAGQWGCGLREGALLRAGPGRLRIAGGGPRGPDLRTAREEAEVAAAAGRGRCSLGPGTRPSGCVLGAPPALPGRHGPRRGRPLPVAGGGRPRADAGAGLVLAASGEPRPRGR